MEPEKIIELAHFINDYYNEHGQKPKQMLIDRALHMMLAQSGGYQQISQLQGIVCIPSANIDGCNAPWKVMS